MSRDRHIAVPGVVLALIAALSVAGCGSGRHAGVSGAATTGTTTTTATTTVTTGTASTTTTQPLPGTGKPQVVLGDKNTPEQFILGELYDVALTAQGYDVLLTRNIGATQATYLALQQGSLDVYPEYLNTWDSVVAGDNGPFRSLSEAYHVGEAFAHAHGMELLDPTPFSDTPGLAVTTGYAEANQLHTVPDLGGVANLVIGAPPEFSQSPSGLPLLEHAYGFAPTTVAPVDIGSQYAELRNGSIEAAYVQSTDGQLETPEFELLGDPKHVFGFGNVVPVVSATAIANEGPTFTSTINQIDALLTTPVIRYLNADVELLHENPTAVAQTFLQEHGLIAPPASGSS